MTILSSISFSESLCRSRHFEKPTRSEFQTYMRETGYSSENLKHPIFMSVGILLYFDALITNMIVKITDKVIFKVKIQKKSKIIAVLPLF